MDTLLKSLGVIFLAGILAIGIIVLVVAWKIRRFVKTIGKTLGGLAAAAAPTPARIHLDQMVNIEWDDPKAIAEASKPLEGLGFEDAGTFEVQEVDGLKLWAWVDPERAIYAVVYQHPSAGVWLDLVTRYRDGTKITYANTAQGSGVEHAPGCEVIRLPGLSTADLYRRFVAERPDKPADPVDASRFVEVFEKAYADEMDWRNARGPSDAEIRAIAAASGEEYDEDTLAATREALREQAAEGLNEALRERFLEQTSMSATEWERVRDRLVIVHDKLTPEMLAGAAAWMYDDDEEAENDDDDGVPAWTREGPPRQAFAAYNRQLTPDRRFRKLAELNEPVGADVYEAPDV